MNNVNSLILSAVVCLSILATVGCGSKEEAKPEKPQVNSTDYLGAMSKSVKVAENVTDVSSVQQAVNMFQASEERYPANLNEVVTEGYLPVLPELPAGYVYSYDSQTGKVRAVRQ